VYLLEVNGERAHGAAVEAAEEADEARPPGDVAGELQGALDALGARLGDRRSSPAPPSGELGQALAERTWPSCQ
jgi:hypothetical protein